jgi:adenylate cyclase
MQIHGIHSKSVRILLSVVGAALLALLFAQTTPARFVENLTYDLRLAFAAPPASDELVIVKIDDRALEDMRAQSACGCLSPIDKTWLANLVRTLDQHGARSIGIDYLFDTWHSTNEFVVVREQLAPVKTPLVVVVDPRREAERDYPVLSKAIYADARVLLRDEFDDTVRRYDLTPGALPSLALALAESGGFETAQRGNLRLRFHAPHPEARNENVGAIVPSFSASDIELLPGEFFRDKIVLIGRVTRAAGSDAESLREDLHVTPLHYLPGHLDGTPGVEVHAHALTQLIAGSTVRLPGLPLALLLALLAAAGGAGLGRSASGWGYAVRWLLGGSTAVVIIGWQVMAQFSLMLPMVAPFTAFALSFFVVSQVAASDLAAQRKLYATALERYLAPQVVRRIEDGSQPVQIGAAMREITVLFTDLENSSAFVADTPLEKFSPIINGYFDGLFEVLWRHEAMLDKMTGDGVVVLFGAPVLHADHADRALACARDITRFAQQYRQAVQREHGIAFGKTRIGIHSGEALVGNFGGQKRFNYTAYGQTVVIAARLENANKTLGSTVLVSAATVARLRNASGLVPVGTLTLKGVDKEIAACTLADADGVESN